MVSFYYRYDINLKNPSLQIKKMNKKMGCVYLFYVAATSFNLFLTYLNGKIAYSDYFDGGTIL